MSTITHVKSVTRQDPSLLDIINAAMTGGRTIRLYNTNTDYAEGSYVYRIVNNNVVVYRALQNIDSDGSFNPNEWAIIEGLGDYSAIVISDIEPENHEVDLWFKPLKYENHDIESIASQFDPRYLSCKYKVNGSATSYTDLNLPVASTPENTYSYVDAFVNGPNIVGNRSFPSCYNGFPITTFSDELFKDNTAITGFDTGSLETIPVDGFSGCSNLASITIGSYLKTISAGAFFETKLSTVTFPANVNSIASSSFGNCTYLTTINVYNPNMLFDANAFIGTTIDSINGYTGSTAQAYAVANGIAFNVLE